MAAICHLKFEGTPVTYVNARAAQGINVNGNVVASDGRYLSIGMLQCVTIEHFPKVLLCELIWLYLKIGPGCCKNLYWYF